MEKCQMNEKIKTLKEYFGVGSSQAFNYLKIRESFRELKDKAISSELLRKLDYEPSVNEISNLSTSIKNILGEIIETGIYKQGLKHNLLGKIISVKQYGKAGEIDEDYLERVFKSEETKWFEFDYPSFIKNFYLKKIEGKNYEEAFHLNVSELVNKKSEILYDPLNKKYYSLEDFFNGKIDVLLNGEMDKDLLSREMIDDREGEIFSWIEFGGYSPYLMHPEELSKESSNFLFNINFGEYEVLNNKIQKKDLFERTKRDGTLYDIHKERKIAMNYILQNNPEWGNTNLEDDSIKKFLENSIDVLRNRSIPRKFRLLDKLKNFFPTSFMKSEMNGIEKSKYILHSLEENKKWLNEEISYFLKERFFEN